MNPTLKKKKRGDCAAEIGWSIEFLIVLYTLPEVQLKVPEVKAHKWLIITRSS
jgi:hypothetical protein